MKWSPGARGNRGSWSAAVAALLLVCLAGCGPSPDTLVGTVTVATEPPGAEIMARGFDRGPSPVTITGLEPGTVTVVAKMEGYETAHETFQLKAGEHKIVRLELEHKVGYVTIRSEPVEAEAVLADGTVLGATPLFRVALPIGKHSYELRHPDYEPTSKTWEVQENFEYNFIHQLTPLKATLTVFSRPTSAIIWINEERQAEKSPARFQLRPGAYSVAVQRGGYLRREEIVVLEPNREARVDLSLPPGEEPPGMVLIPEGPFLFGQTGAAPDESPQREIFLPDYYIDRTEVTNAAFKEVFSSHNYPEGRGDFPVSGVSFTQAMDYARRVGKRLPTEAEWEKAARGTDGRAYPWGELFDSDLCNIEESGIQRPTRAGAYPLGASPYRVLDMAGNVYEWVSDWYEAYPGNTLINKEYGQIYRVLRGGSYRSPRYDARCARRHFDRMDAARADYGFRCVKDLPREP